MTSSESNSRPLQFGMRSLFLATTAISIYTALCVSLGATLLTSILFAVLLAARVLCVVQTHRLLVAIPALLVVLTIPILYFDTIHHQFTSPYSRWSSVNWIGTVFCYLLVPTIMLLFDISANTDRTGQWRVDRLVVDFFVVLPLWMLLMIAIAGPMGHIP